MSNLLSLPAVEWLRAQVPLTAHLTSDSRKVASGDVFLAYPGEKFDGRAFIEQAISNGAAAVLFDPADGFAANLAVSSFAVAGLKMLAGEIAAGWYGEPSKRLFSIAVTGTSGKSTTALWLAQLFQALGHRAALIGTLGAGMLDALSDTGHTTPDPVDLERLLARLVTDGAEVMAMEVTSVGLVEGRANGLHFDVALFTNLSRDHLDYHGTMDEYRDAKARLFSWPGLIAGVINLDDPASLAMRSAMLAEVQCISYSASGQNAADLYASNIEFQEHGMQVKVAGRFGEHLLEAPVVGRFNVDNLLGVVAVGLAAGIEFEQLAVALRCISAAPGRLEPVLSLDGGEPTGPLVLIDYAHKPDALEKVLEACRPMALQRQGKLIVLFGCGGDRDRGKRPIMGEIAARLADRLVLTSDNPRSESPASILDEIYAGVPVSLQSKVEKMVDRRSAIESVVAKASGRDVVLIAGKGHETYQEIAGVKTPFSDVSEARLALSLRRETAPC
jgi:UDP-N-acetylmuramoyl-L-alanyl-D-glutamate--2,6-diaminopimelate ligase